MGRPGILPEYACPWAHHSRRELPDVGKKGPTRLHGITIVRMDRDEPSPEQHHQPAPRLPKKPCIAFCVIFEASEKAALLLFTSNTDSK